MRYPEWHYACMKCVKSFEGFLRRKPTSCAHCHRADWDKRTEYFIGGILIYDPKNDPYGAKTLEAAYKPTMLIQSVDMVNNRIGAERLMSPKVRRILNDLKKEGL